MNFRLVIKTYIKVIIQTSKLSEAVKKGMVTTKEIRLLVNPTLHWISIIMTSLS